MAASTGPFMGPIQPTKKTSPDLHCSQGTSPPGGSQGVDQRDSSPTLLDHHHPQWLWPWQGDKWKKCETYFEMATKLPSWFWSVKITDWNIGIYYDKNSNFGLVVGILDVFKSMTCLCLKGPEGEDGVTVAGGSWRVSLQAVGSTAEATT